MISARPLTSTMPTIKIVAMPSAEPVINPKNEAIGARFQSLAGRKRHHHFGARFADQVRHGNELVALRAQRVDDLRQRRNGLRAVAAAVVKQDDVAVVGLPQHVVDDFLRGNLAFRRRCCQSCGSIFWPTIR